LDYSFEDYQVQVAPSKGTYKRSLVQNEKPYCFSSEYYQSSFANHELVESGKPFHIRKTVGCNLSFFPFNYDYGSKTLRVYNHLVVEVVFSSTESGIRLYDQEFSNAFTTIFSDIFLNYTRDGDRMSRLPQIRDEMLILCCDSFCGEMRDFVIHKNNMGLKTRLVSLNRVGNSVSDIASFIQEEYNTNENLVYVLFVGDIEKIPSFSIQNWESSDYFDPNLYPNDYILKASDPSYGLVSGNDEYPDLIVGRFPARTKDDVKSMVLRSISHENIVEHQWFHVGMGIASNEGFNTRDNIVMHEITDTLLSGHFSEIVELFDGVGSDPTANETADLINSGVSVINYAGHGSIDGWGTSHLSQVEVARLINYDRLPFVFSLACNVCDLTAGYISFGEMFLLSGSNFSNTQTGAIGFYGSSTEQSFEEPYVALRDFNSSLIQDEPSSYGSLCLAASLLMVGSFSGDALLYAFHDMLSWIYLGDPSLMTIPNNNVGKTLFLSDEILDVSYFTKDFIDIKDASISSGAHVTVNHGVSTIINGHFMTGDNSVFIIK